jgi:hypothetical protein
MKKRLLLIIVSSTIVMSSYSQMTKENVTTTFFSEYKKDALTAYLNLFLNNKWMSSQQSTIETNKIKLKDLLDQLGEYNGYEFITEKQAGPSYILKSFLAKYDRQPVRYTFILYKPQDIWQLQNVIWDVDFDEELKEAAKIDRLRSNWE